MQAEGWLRFSALLHCGAFLIFFAAAVHSFRQGKAFRKSAAEFDRQMKASAEHVQKLAHNANNEALKWILRNATDPDDGTEVPK